MKRILVTGSAGFIGSHFVDHVHKNTDWHVIGIDSFRHRGDSLRTINKDHTRYDIHTHDLTAPLSDRQIAKIGHIDYIINFASESHVDRSIIDPVPFVENNVKLMLNMLEYARKIKPEVMIQISCYDKETRTLTKNGLKYYHELKEGDIVFTLNENKEIEEKPIQKIIKQKYDGDMVRMSNGLVDMKITPNHRMYNDDMNVQEADSLLSMGNNNSYKLPYPKKFKGKEEPIYINGVSVNLYDLFYLSGAYIGDGFCSYQEKETENKSGLTKKEFIKRRDSLGHFVSGRTGNIKKIISKAWRIFFDVPENNKARKRLEETLNNIGISYTSQKGKSGEHIYITSEIWSKYFKQFGKGEKNKIIPDWMLKYDYKYLKCLFDGMIDTDGHYRGNGGIAYTTSSVKLMEKTCELGFKIGKYPKSYHRYCESYIGNRKISGYAYNVIFGNRPKAIKTNRINLEKYNDHIWCITVENKNFLTERNGAFAFSGNTDEVYGAALQGMMHSEWSMILPSNPYSASKSSQESLAYSYWRTYQLPIVIINSMNLTGEQQDKEKFIPMIISRILKGEEVIIHGDENGIGSRFYLHSRNQADAILFILKNTTPTMYRDSLTEIILPDRYNIVGDVEVNNLEMAQMIAEILDKPLKYKLVNFHATRPGHDRRYALDGRKMREMGWVAPVPFYESLKKTVEWTVQHPEWMV